jgi:hypothetical protein
MLPALNAPFAVTRITCTSDQLGMKLEIPAEDAFVVTLHLVGVRHHELWVRGRPAVVRSYSRGAISIVDLRDEVATYLGSPLDSLEFYVPHALVDAVADAAGVARVSALSCLPGLIDPVMRQLGAAILHLFDNPRFATPAVLEHLAIAISAHLLHRFGKNAGSDVPAIGPSPSSPSSPQPFAFKQVTLPRAAWRRQNLH